MSHPKRTEHGKCHVSTATTMQFPQPLQHSTAVCVNGRCNRGGQLRILWSFDKNPFCCAKLLLKALKFRKLLQTAPNSMKSNEFYAHVSFNGENSNFTTWFPKQSQGDDVFSGLIYWSIYKSMKKMLRPDSKKWPDGLFFFFNVTFLNCRFYILYVSKVSSLKIMARHHKKYFCHLKWPTICANWQQNSSFCCAVSPKWHHRMLPSWYG